MSQHYSDSSREDDPYALPDVEVFRSDDYGDPSDDNIEPLESGWYYWYCFPGCLPDSDAYGPYDSEDEAVEASQGEP